MIGIAALLVFSCFVITGYALAIWSQQRAEAPRGAGIHGVVPSGRAAVDTDGLDAHAGTVVVATGVPRRSGVDHFENGVLVCDSLELGDELRPVVRFTDRTDRARALDHRL